MDHIAADPEIAARLAPDVTLATTPGSVFLLPHEAPDQVDEVIATALSQAAI
jgi:hypothetical protein